MVTVERPDPPEAYSIASPCYFLRPLLPLLVLGTTALAFPPLPRADLYGDALPQGATARLGTDRLRAGSMSIAFSPDGKKLIGADGGAIREWNAGDGRFIRAIGERGEEYPRPWRSENGRTLLRLQTNTVELKDLVTGQKLDLAVPKDRKRLYLGVVSDDRRWLFLADVVGQREPLIRGGFNIPESLYQLVLWDTSTSKSRVLSDGETGLISLAVSPDGRKVASTGSAGTRVWDTASGKLLWEVPNYTSEQMHFTPDNKVLIAALGGGQREWRIWDADTGKPAKDFIAPPRSYVWMFAVSPDGNSLLMPTETDYLLWDMKKGEVRQRWPGARQFGQGAFAPDGRSVVTYDTIFRKWDVVTGKNLYDDVASLGHVASVKKLFYSPDGKRLVSVDSARTARVWDVASSKLLRTISLESPTIDAWTITRDGNTLVGIDEKLSVHRWSMTTDVPRATVDLREAQRLDIRLQARDIRFAPNGSLVLLAWPRSPEYSFFRFSFSFWDLTTGKLRYWGGDPGLEYRGDYTRLAPDGSWVASGEAIHDTRTGARRVLPLSPISAAHLPTFSPDSRLIAASSDGTRVWEVATGRVLCDLPRGVGVNDVVAFSPDCRRLACLGDNKLIVWDLAENRAVIERPFPQHVPPRERWISGGLAFSPDGRTLATGNSDGTILLWSVPAVVPESRWNDAEGTAMLDSLGDEILANVYPGLWQLAAQPADAVRMLKAKYPLVPAALPDEWKKLIGGLDSPRFAEREAASKRLEQLGRAAIMPLRQALKEKPSAEQVKRIETLLTELDPAGIRPRGDDLRAVRAVAVLEMCGTEKARELLSQWAERGPSPKLADEAARAVERIRSVR